MDSKSIVEFVFQNLWPVLAAQGQVEWTFRDVVMQLQPWFKNIPERENGLAKIIGIRTVAEQAAQVHEGNEERKRFFLFTKQMADGNADGDTGSQTEFAVIG